MPSVSTLFSITITGSLTFLYPLSDLWSPGLASSKTAVRWLWWLLLIVYLIVNLRNKKVSSEHIFGCELQECLPSGLNKEMSSPELKLGLHIKRGKEKAHWEPVLSVVCLLTCLDLGHASHSLPCLPTIIDYGTLSNHEQANPSPIGCFFAKDLVSTMTRVTELQIIGLSQSSHPKTPWLYFLWSLASLMLNPVAMFPLAIYCNGLE